MSKQVLAVAIVAALIIASAGVVAMNMKDVTDTGGSSGKGDNNGVTDLPDPIPPSKETTVTLTMGMTTVKMGETIFANGKLSGKSGIADAKIALSVIKPDGTIAKPSEASVTTDDNGEFTMSFIPTVVGAYKFVASFAGDSNHNKSEGKAMFTVVKRDPTPCDKLGPSRVDMVSVPTTMVAGQTYTFECQLFVREYNIYCELQSWRPGLDAAITWTFTNSNGISVSVESTTSLSDGTASMEFPCYMAGTWSVEAHWAGNAKYLAVDGHATVKATGNTVYWNGFWITVEKWYKTADPAKYPTDFGWDINYGYDPAFVLLKVDNAQDVINPNLYIGGLFLTDTNKLAYSGMSGAFIGTNEFTSALAPGAEARVWVCFWIPNDQSLVINGMYGVVNESYDWYYNSYGYLGPTSYNVKIPLPAESPA
jgi:hypothetical protein